MPYSVPGWDVEDQDSDFNNTDTEDNEINDNSYAGPIINTAQVPQSNTLITGVNSIKPIPSQIMLTQYEGGELPITLDSGATMSFIRMDYVTKLNIPFRPNNQYATLADQQTTIRARGEINILVTYRTVVLRLRALIVDRLQAPCFGGTVFHQDNEIILNIVNKLCRSKVKYLTKK